MLVAVSVLSVVSPKCRATGCSVNTEGSWTAQLWWILSSSILAAAELALHLKGSVACAVTRLAMLVAVSVLSVVITEMQGNGLPRSTQKGLGRYNFGGSFRVVY
jgi:hypothetical protein